jgi:phage tail sheath protein FI
MGLIGSMKYFESPTFKTVSGVSGLARNYTPSNLKEMLKSNVLLLEAKRGRGIIVEKGISTSGEQISVTRIADRAVRGVKMIGDAFIGTLNSHQGRAALAEKITEFFIQMERDGAIVPNAAKTDPAFKVDVYASDSDISKGIVRVDVAVRPVRAIDYIYGTIFVKA